MKTMLRRLLPAAFAALVLSASAPGALARDWDRGYGRDFERGHHAFRGHDRHGFRHRHRQRHRHGHGHHHRGTSLGLHFAPVYAQPVYVIPQPVYVIPQYRTDYVYGAAPRYVRSGMAAPTPNFGSAVGGAIGGYLGSQIGNGSGRLAATAAGAVIGYSLGGQLGSAGYRY